MRVTCLLVMMASLPWPTDAEAETECTVRTLDQASAEALDLGRAISPVFRAVLARFDSCSVVVHVVSGDIPVFGAAGMTRLTGAVGPWRYVRIVLDARLDLAARTAVLAHELWHALEIVESDAVDQDDVRRLYERIGHRTGATADAFETSAAAATGARVWRDVRGVASRRASPQ